MPDSKNRVLEFLNKPKIADAIRNMSNYSLVAKKNALKHALIGGGLGLGAGYLAADDEDSKKVTALKLLLGAGAGAGAAHLGPRAIQRLIKI